MVVSVSCPEALMRLSAMVFCKMRSTNCPTTTSTILLLSSFCMRAGCPFMKVKVALPLNVKFWQASTARWRSDDSVVLTRLGHSSLAPHLSLLYSLPTEKVVKGHRCCHRH